MGKNEEKENKLNKLCSFRSRLKKEVGTGIVDLEKHDITNVRYWISTGNYAVDSAIGGGFPCGKIIELSGEFSSGKTLLALQTIREVQKIGGLAVYMDTESAFNKEWANNLGVKTDSDSLIYVVPKNTNEVLEFMESFVRGIKEEEFDVPSLVVWDSIAGTPVVTDRSIKKNKDDDIDYTSQERMGGEMAVVLSSALRNMTADIRDTNICFFMINQLRDVVGQVYGPKKRSSGGNAKNYYASILLEISSGKNISDDNGGVVGKECKIYVRKNKVGYPFKEANFHVYFDSGIDYFSGAAETLTKNGVIEKSGGWYVYGEDKMRVSAVETKEFFDRLREDGKI